MEEKTKSPIDVSKIVPTLSVKEALERWKASGFDSIEVTKDEYIDFILNAHPSERPELITVRKWNGMKVKVL